jgi:L-iditol 2-dehydrogenase
MEALVKYASGRGNVELRDVPEPSPRSHQVRVAVKAAGVCGSDIHIYDDDIQIPIHPPVVMGHEFAGVITEAGSAVETVQVGDRVTCETSATYCGRCLQCRLGAYNMCAERQVLGYAIDGCFAPYCVVNETQVHVLPPNVDFLSASLSEPLACAVHAVVENTCVSVGDVVAIAGPGPMGLLCLQVVKSAGGYAIVTGTSHDADRLDLARRLGADETIDVEHEDALERIRARTYGRGSDVFLECSGAPAAARLGLVATRRGGQYTQIGLFSEPFELDFSLIAYKEIRVSGALGQKWTAWKRGLDLLARDEVDTRSLITHVLPLAQWRAAFDMVAEKRGVKIVLQPAA